MDPKSRISLDSMLSILIKSSPALPQGILHSQDDFSHSFALRLTYPEAGASAVSVCFLWADLHLAAWNCTVLCAQFIAPTIGSLSFRSGSFSVLYPDSALDTRCR